MATSSWPLRRTDVARRRRLISLAFGCYLGTIALAGGPEAGVMVGDSDIDYRTAAAADVPIVMVSFGYGPAPQAMTRPCPVIDHFGELEPHLRRLLPASRGAKSGLIRPNPAADRA